jgi:hypothetical protein
MARGDLGFTTLSANINKNVDLGTDYEDGAIVLAPELTLATTDENLLLMAKRWKSASEDYQGKITEIQERNERYWKGEHFSNSEMSNGMSMVDNLMFEALETWIPMVNKKNPDPMVTGPQEVQLLAKSVQQYLAAEADRERLILRLQRVARYWALSRLGVGKMSWDMRVNDSRLDILRSQDCYFDPDGYVNDDMEFTGSYIGHKMKDEVSSLMDRFPAKKSYFTTRYGDQTGTKCKYIEWWTDTFFFVTNFEVTEVFTKAMNPHWNYDLDHEIPVQKEVPFTDDYGNEAVRMEESMEKETIPGANHFEYVRKPFILLSVYNLGKQPHDETGNMEQAIPNQDVVNKRNKQIDKNIDKMNGGLVISGENSGLSKEDAALASKAIDRGGAIFIPAGTPADAVARIQANGLPSDVYEERNDKRNELRNIFGTSGSTPDAIKATETAAGKGMIREADTDRAGGGISKYIEQFADQYFNWKVQMMYVYYDEPHLRSVMGDERAQQTVSIVNSDLGSVKLTVSVKPGSMLPRDEISEADTAIQLGTANLIDPITMYDKLGFSNPREMAKRLWIWQNAPDQLFADDPDIQRIVQQQQQQEILAAQASAISGGGTTKLPVA